MAMLRMSYDSNARVLHHSSKNVEEFLSKEKFTKKYFMLTTEEEQNENDVIVQGEILQ